MVVSSMVGAIAAGIAIVMWFFKKKGRTLTVCCLLAGFAVAWPLSQALAGPLAALDQIAAWVTVNLLLAAAASTWLFFQLKEKGTKAFTPWVALMTPALFVLAAGPFLLPLDLVGDATTQLESGLSTVSR